MGIEYRFPFLDRELVDYLLRVPREQLIKPGRRRCLMRRALAATVPEEILERKRKAYISRSAILMLRGASNYLKTIFTTPRLGDYGMIRVDDFRLALDSTVRGDPSYLLPILKTIQCEVWLRSLTSVLHSVEVRELPSRISMYGITQVAKP